ncbi:MAG TPA: sigma-70 factor domain-containing protein, partial [Anaerolineales bacterium]|nr:sigma-70 factor domain-containing protein [Anaerolineales bacterium]
MAEHKRTVSNNSQKNERTPRDAEFSDSSLPVDVDAMLNELPELARDDAPDPDASALSQQEDLLDEPIDLKDPAFAAELADDPVRLYLREIGQVNLLDANSEFHLATMIEANRLIVSLGRHPLRKGLSTECAIYHALIAEMLTSWERLLEDTSRLHCEPPNLTFLLNEAKALSSESKEPSYLRNFLDNGLWGMDELWNSIARKAYSVFLSLYLLPSEYADWLLKHLNSHHQFPNQRT